jgi:DNA-binding GntR family transcriptional regulator
MASDASQGVSGQATPLADAPLFREQVYRQLRSAILGGELPRGSRLSPSKLAAQLGISTMLIRDALRLLEENCLTHGDRDGFAHRRILDDGASDRNGTCVTKSARQPDGW